MVRTLPLDLTSGLSSDYGTSHLAAVSFPLPPLQQSEPDCPSMASLPFCPNKRSLPAPPFSTSFPAPPNSLSCLDFQRVYRDPDHRR